MSDPESVTCQALEQKQRSNDLELLRIELESKKLQMEAMKHEFQAKMDEMEERTESAERTARVFQAKVSHLSVERDQRKNQSQATGQLFLFGSLEKLIY